MSLPKVHIFLLTALLYLPLLGWAQQSEPSISYGNTTIETTEKFTIKIVIRDKSYDVSDFPQIEGFSKGSRSVAHATFKKNGVRGIEHTITQSYLPKGAGTFKLSPTTITVNGIEQNLPGETINVLIDKPSNSYAADSLQITTMDIDEKEDAQLFLNTFKGSVFVGQGFKVTVGFYVSDLNTAGWDFPADLNNQVEAIAQAIKPNNCLESRLLITNITPQRTRINDKGYTKYTLFEAIYYPLNTNPITFNPVSLTMLKMGNGINQDTKRTFMTKVGKISVKPLPEHPLKDKVPVGSFYLREWLTNGTAETGSSVPYEFSIIGEGNFATVNLPTPQNDARFDFYPAEVQSKLKEGSLKGNRTFKYMIFPKDSGTIALNNYFKFIFFNVKKADYDTLSSNVTINISGDKISSATFKQNDIYAGIADINSADIPVNYRLILKNLANALIIGMMITLLFMMRKKT